MSAPQTEEPRVSSRARRVAKQLAEAGDRAADAGDVVVRADPAGAANLMREIVALHTFDVALEEHDGHWQVVVRGGPHPESVLARIVDLTASCVEHGLMRHATLCIGSRSYTIEPTPGSEAEIPACAA